MTQEQPWVPPVRPRRAAVRAAPSFEVRPPRGRETDPPVVLATGSQRLQDEVARITAAAGLELEVTADVRAGFARNPEVLLLGSDLSAAGPPGGWRQDRTGPHGPETVLVGTAQDTALWQDAARLEVARVAVLPAAAGWLAEYLSRRRAGAAGFVLGVLGGSGGAGASTLACWLAHEAAEQGLETLLVDGDPHGGGLDASLGSTGVPGVRWPDLVDVRGSLNPAQLVSALPRAAGFSLLSGIAEEAEEDPPEESTAAVLDAARGAFALTVVDCARQRGPDLLLASCDALLLVVPGRLRPLLAARSLNRGLRHVQKAAVIRGPLGDGLDEVAAAEAVGLRLAGYLPAVPHLEHAEARGQLLERGRRRQLRRVTAQLLAPFIAGLPEPLWTDRTP